MSKKFVELGTLGILTFDDVQINAAQLTPNGPAFYQEKNYTRIEQLQANIVYL